MLTFDAVLPARRLGDHLGGGQLVHVAQGHLREQQQTGGAGPRRETVVGRLGHHVSKVDALAKHVTRHGGLGRGDPQALGQDARVVGQPGPVPQQLPVVELLERLVTLLLALALHNKHVLDAEPVLGVRGGVGVGDVVGNGLEQGVRRGEDVQFRLELLVVRVDRVVGRGDHLVGDFDLEQVVEHLGL